MKKRLLGLVCVLIASAMVIGLAQPLKATSIDEEKKKQQDMENNLDDIQDTLDKLETMKNDMNEYIKTMDSKLEEVSAKIVDLNDKTAAKQAEIEEINVKLAAQEEDIQSQYESMKLRIRFMYENGQNQYMDMMLGSGSFGDFLNKAEYISELTTYDRNMLDKMRETKKQIEETKATLQTEQDNLQTLLDEANAEQESMEKLVEAKRVQLAATQQEISDAESEAKAMKADIEDQKQLIAAMQEAERKLKEEQERKRREEEERRRQEELNRQNNASNTNNNSDNNSDNNNNNSGGGSFVWPCPSSRRITSDYGLRGDPFGNSSSSEFHKGIDIGAPVGTPIVATASGVVAWARSSSSAGNWVVINHGDNLISVYMHMAYYIVSGGDYVEAGQVIGYVGLTG
ncbi:MAG: peptidoglycan DD-metalloendopeptidase family protein, partial [Lachnospiraceae bacterium]|nr:peptidoglycan DD-metalloendopeptidase family protein [Lachnospiraceae bacterium]